LVTFVHGELVLVLDRNPGRVTWGAGFEGRTSKGRTIPQQSSENRADDPGGRDEEVA
jgi:hypothetical protein